MVIKDVTVEKQSGNPMVKISRFSLFTADTRVIKGFIVLVVVLILVLITSAAAVAIPIRYKSLIGNSRTTTIITGTTCERRRPDRTATSVILKMTNGNDAVNDPSFPVPMPPISPAQSTTVTPITSSTAISAISSSTVKKGFGPPPPQPSEDEVQAKGKRAAQKAKYREAIKMAKKMPQLRKIVTSGSDEKVRDRTNTKGSGGAV